MLKKVKPQAVVIASPLYLHFEMSKAAVKAGCAVFCEKTMCYSVDEAGLPERAARRRAKGVLGSIDDSAIVSLSDGVVQATASVSPVCLITPDETEPPGSWSAPLMQDQI